jgi:septum formation protein
MTLWTPSSPLILASASATRRSMLSDAGIPVDVIPAAIDERSIDAALRAIDAPPHDIATALARAKAQSISAIHPGRIVLGADQVLDCAGQIYDKAASRAGAEEHLLDFQDRTHRLTSAASIVVDGAILFETYSAAHLTMRRLDSRAISHYAALAGPVLTRSVGAYEIEGLGAHLFSRIEGDHFTIRGLPLLELLAGMRAEGWLAW